jgi:hypothetical protein
MVQILLFGFAYSTKPTDAQSTFIAKHIMNSKLLYMMISSAGYDFGLPNKFHDAEEVKTFKIGKSKYILLVMVNMGRL